MRRLGERPLITVLGGQADKNRAVSFLWRAIVSRVDGARQDPVCLLATDSAFRMLAKPGEVRPPGLFAPKLEVGERELQCDVLKITRERGPKEAPDIFEDEGLGTYFADGPN